ncbi:choline transporter-like protein 4 [Trichomycterus rosablanca]|uniref:choline transporter-like protein 4 n=1 Tax=Trichomycterus rosablanca TaxID=2290929 RepID=UPI002F35B7BD
MNRKLNSHDKCASFKPFWNGPVRKRNCTDIIWCVIFMAATVGYMIIGVLAWLYGDPRHILYPQNSTGMLCGVEVNVDKPYIFYINVLKCATTSNITASTSYGLHCPTTQVCVKQCPSEFWKLPPDAFTAHAQPKDFFQQQYCDSSLDLAHTTKSVQDILDQDLCPDFYTPSKPVLGRCLPSFDFNHIPSNFTLQEHTINNMNNATNVTQEHGINNMNNATNVTLQERTIKAIKDATDSLVSGFNVYSVAERIFIELATSWYWILLGLLAAMSVCVAFLLLMTYFMSVLVWVLIVGVLIVGAYGIYYCYKEYSNYVLSKLTFGDLTFNSEFSTFLQVKETWLAFLVILCLVQFVMLLQLIRLRKTISFSLALMEESSRVVCYVTSTLVYPFVTFVLVVLCVSYWVIINLYLTTSGTSVYHVISLNYPISNCHAITGQRCLPQTFNASAYTTCPNVRCVFFKYDKDGFFQRNMLYIYIYNILAFNWYVNFLVALGQCTLAGTFASYYWAFNKPADIPPSPLLQAFNRTLRFHVGSVAFGAVFLTTFQGFRISLEYLANRLRSCHNSCSRFLMTSLRCCFWFLEKFLKFFNRNTYIMIAIHGDNFWESARSSHMLIIRNISRVLVLDSVTDTLLFFCKLLVIGAIGVLAFMFFSGHTELPKNIFQAKMLHYNWVTITVVLVGTYFIAQGFFSVYSMCVDTLFLCFLEDLEQNKGTVQRPYRSRSLMQIFNKSKKHYTPVCTC